MQSSQNQRIKSVKFNPDTIHNKAKTLTLKIGGKKNRSTAVEVELHILAPKDKIQEADKMRQHIETMHIYPLNIKPSDIETLISSLALFLELDGMHAVKNQLTNAVHCFFQNVINAMPCHPIDRDNPGYQAYENELLAIHTVIQFITDKLTQHKLFINQPFTIHNATQLVQERIVINPHPMPPDLDGFLKSIDDCDVCRTQWKEYFSNFSANDISQYFLHVLRMIQASSTPNDMAIYVDWKLNRFIDTLDSRIPHFSIHIMRDALRSTVIQMMDESAPPIQSKMTTFKKELIQRLDGLITANRTFNQDFLQFRGALTVGLQRHAPFKDMILTQLQIYLSGKLVTTKTSTRLHPLQVYIDQGITRLSQPLPNALLPFFDIMKNAYQQSQVSSRQHYKLIFLNALRDKIKEYPEKSYAECYRLTKNAMNPAIQAILGENNYFRFFSHPQHRFKDFLALLSQSDMDYESVFPT